MGFLDLTTLSGAKFFVERISHLYHEDGFRELTPGLFHNLEEVIELFEKNKDKEPWIKETLKDALFFKENMPEIKLFKLGEFHD